MEQELSHLRHIFDSFPEPVLCFQGLHIYYINPAGELSFPIQEGSFSDQLLSLFPEQDEPVYISLEFGVFYATIASMPYGRLVVLRPDNRNSASPDYFNVPAHLRNHLTNLTAAMDQISRRLAQEHKTADYAPFLTIQNQAIHRILRLIRQMELSSNDWESEYPIGIVDFAELCRTLADEVSAHNKGASFQFIYKSDISSLPLSGNRGLLEQLILSILSNGIKSAGPGGTVELSLSRQKNRVILSTWDSGPGIPEHRLLHLFSPKTSVDLPLPEDGVGLDLWIAQRIISFHHGVIMAGNHPQTGAEFTISLPITPPSHLMFQSKDHLFQGEGFSPVLVGLADVLPSGSFALVME